MVADLVIRWAVTLLFAIAAAESVLCLAIARGRPLAVVSLCFQLLMSVAMAAMAWPDGSALSIAAPISISIAATIWFGVAAVLTEDWIANTYHAVMGLGMTWMYAAMNGTQSLGGYRDTGGGDNADPMPAMDMSGAPASEPALVNGANLLWAVGFAIAAVFWVCRCIARRKHASKLKLLQIICLAATAAGMAFMFAAMP